MKTLRIILYVILFCGYCSCHQESVPISVLNTFKTGINTISMKYDGLDRDFIVQLPSSFDQNKTYPLVFYFHGMNGKKENSQLIFGPIVESENAIGVFPQGHLGTWNVEQNDGTSKTNDLGFTLEIIKMIQTGVKIDESRIYSLGYSNGGAFSYYLAQHTDRFASVAAISASFFADSKIAATVNKTSVIQMNGEVDLWVPYQGGKSAYLPLTFASAINSAKLWVIHNEINENPIVTNPYEKITLYTFKTAGNPYEVRLYKLQETGHEIGSHPYIYSGQCNKDIWEFFKQHPKIKL